MKYLSQKKNLKYLTVLVLCLFILIIGFQNCKEGAFITESESIKTSTLDSKTASTTLVSETSIVSTTTMTVTTDLYAEFSVKQSVLQERKADILFVVDDSKPMLHHQGKLEDRFKDLFSDDLQFIDWQMAFINTSAGCPEEFNKKLNRKRRLCERGSPPESPDGSSGHFYYIKESSGEDIRDENNNKIKILTPALGTQYDLFELFKNTVKALGNEGDFIEVPLANIVRSVQLTENKNFFREDAYLVALIFSNEDEGAMAAQYYSGNSDILLKPEPGPIKHYNQVIQAIQDSLGDFKKFIAYGIIVQPNDQDCLKLEKKQAGSEAVSYGHRINDLVRETNGVTHSICNDDYAPIITQIARHIAKILQINDIKLRHKNVIPNTIRLTFNPQENAVDSRYDAQTNTVIFNAPPEGGTTVTVSYNYQE